MVRSRLSARLGNIAETAITTARDPTAGIPLDDAEALLLEVDSVFGEGSGSWLEEAGKNLVTPNVTERSSGTFTDLASAAHALRPQLEQAFEGVRLFYDLEGGDLGVALTLGIAGRPRSARILRHLVIGYVKAVANALGLRPTSFRIYSEMLGDRAAIKLRADEHTAPHSRSPTGRRRSSLLRAPSSTLAEVERILASSTAPPPSRSSGSWPAIRESSPEIEDRPSEEHTLGDAPATDETAPAADQDAPRPSRRGSY